MTIMHITENSLYRIANQYARVRNSAAIYGCGAGIALRAHAVIVNEVFSPRYALDGIAEVTCPDCRALIDVALEQSHNIGPAVALLMKTKQAQAQAQQPSVEAPQHSTST
jgi:hypothetical protein